MTSNHRYVSKSEQNPFWYENIYRLDFDHIFYLVRDRYVKKQRDIKHDWYADRIGYSVTKPDLSY